MFLRQMRFAIFCVWNAPFPVDAPPFSIRFRAINRRSVHSRVRSLEAVACLIRSFGSCFLVVLLCLMCFPPLVPCSLYSCLASMGLQPSRCTKGKPPSPRCKSDLKTPNPIEFTLSSASQNKRHTHTHARPFCPYRTFGAELLFDNKPGPGDSLRQHAVTNVNGSGCRRRHMAPTCVKVPRSLDLTVLVRVLN